eukprot:1899765-Ditylum_brightwellii.AAC.1
MGRSKALQRLEQNWPNITVIDSTTQIAPNVNIAVSYNTGVVDKTAEKITKYYDLEIAFKKNWSVKQVNTIQIVIDAFST